MRSFLIDSPEFEAVLPKAVSELTSKNKNFYMGGGDLALQSIKGKSVLNNKVLDVLSGTGQYKVPQRAIGAMLGGGLLKSDDEDFSVLGGIGGYGAAAGLEHGIRGMRQADVDAVLDVIRRTGGLENLNKQTVGENLNKVFDSVRQKDLQGAITDDYRGSKNLLSHPLGATDITGNRQGNAGVLKTYYTGDLMDDDKIADLEQYVKEKFRGFKHKQLPGYDKKQHMNMILSRIDDFKANAGDFKNIGLDAKSLKDTGLDRLIKLHELAESADMLENVPGKLPMSGGALSRAGASELGTTNIIAQHTSPEVMLRENNMIDKLLSGSGKELHKALRTSTGEAQLFKKLLGAELGDVVLSDEYIKKNSDTIAQILNAYKNKKSGLPAKALLDKVRLNPVTSSLGRAGSSLSNLEHSLAKAVKNIVRR